MRLVLGKIDNLRGSGRKQERKKTKNNVVKHHIMVKYKYRQISVSKRQQSWI